MNTNKTTETTETKELLNNYNIANVKYDSMTKAIALCEILSNACNTKDIECIDFNCMSLFCKMIYEEIVTIWNIENPDDKKPYYFDRL